MKNGYDKFFKEARKASGLGGKRPEPPGKSPRELAMEQLRLNQRRRMAKRRTPFPLYPVLSTAALLVLCGAGYHFSDRLDELFSKVEVDLFGQARAVEEAKPAKSEKPAKEGNAEKPADVPAAKAAKDTAAKGGENKPETLNVKQWTPEELSFFGKLSDRKKELDLREAELGKLEEELQKRKAELDEKLKTLEAMRAEISKTLKARVTNDQEKVDKLVQVYSSMKAAQAAKVIETLNEDLAVEVLDKMKKKNAAEILDMMNAKKARRLSELLTGYERTPAASEEAEAPAETAAAAPDTGKPATAKK